MRDPFILLTLAGASLTGLTIVAAVALKGWHGWLELQRLQLAGRASADPAPPSSGSRIELADLKERVRKLEAIAAGVDL